MISIVVPSIRESINRFISSIDASLKEEYELIVVGPDNKVTVNTHLMKSFKFIKDFGSPSRCLQIGISECSSDIFTWGTDDGVYYEDKLKECVELLRTKEENCGITVKYTEEGPYSWFNGSLDDYYISKNHPANVQPGIDPNWQFAPLGMYYTKYLVKLGGFDCRFNHINMNTHDFAYRLQKDGGKLFFSNGTVIHCDSDSTKSDHRVLDHCYLDNDLPLFMQIYRDNSRGIYIDFDNWKNEPEAWRRFA